MESLNDHYRQLLSVGFIVLRHAVDSGKVEWAKAEIELLHNIPSLIDERKLERHRYFWFTEREHYLDWIETTASDEAKSRMKTYYEPIWQEMESTVLNELALADQYEHVKGNAKAKS